MRDNHFVQSRRTLIPGNGNSPFFGEPYQDGDKTVVPLLSMQITGSRLRLKQAAYVEIAGTEARIEPVLHSLKRPLLQVAIIGWNVYWVVRAIRDRRGRK